MTGVPEGWEKAQAKLDALNELKRDESQVFEVQDGERRYTPVKPKGNRKTRRRAEAIKRRG